MRYLLFLKAVRHKDAHTRRLPGGKVVSVRAYDYNDPRQRKLKTGRDKDRATEDMFNPELSGDLFDPAAVRALRGPARTPKVVRVSAGPATPLPDLFEGLAGKEKIAYPGPEASQSGEANTRPKGEEWPMNITATGKKAGQKWSYTVVMPDGTENTFAADRVITHLGVAEMKPGAKGDGRYRIQNRWYEDSPASREAWLARSSQNEWYADARIVPVDVVVPKPKKAAAPVTLADIALPSGYSLAEDGGEILLRGPFDDGLHARIKRLGGRWDGVSGRNRKAWVIPGDKASSLARVLGNVAKDRAPKPFEPTIESGQYAQFHVTVSRGGDGVPAGYYVDFPYDDRDVDAIRAVAGKGGYNASTRRWFVDGEKQDRLKALLDRSVAAQEGLIDSFLDQARHQVETTRHLDHGTAKRLLGLGIAGFPDRQRILDDLQAQSRAAAAAEREQGRQARASARVATVSARMLYPLSDRPALNQPVRVGRQAVVFTERGREFRIDEDHPSIYGSHLLGHEGERAAYYYYRPATESETADLEAAEAAREAARQSAGRVRDIAADIRHRGERPAGMNDPEGQRYHDTQDVYGGGSWFVVGPDWIWFVQNNGGDGDAWDASNVRTGGAGAIGWRVPYTQELAEKIAGTP